MRKVLLVLVAILPAATAAAADRTVSWYAARDEVRARVLAECENDPGRLRNAPDCINARAGDVKATADRLERQRRAPRGRVPPKPTGWWTARPDARDTVLATCRHMNARQRAQFGQCEAAERSISLAGR